LCSRQLNSPLQPVYVNNGASATAAFGTARRGFIEESTPEQAPNVKRGTRKKQDDDEIL
jgi:hypothetical protein